MQQSIPPSMQVPAAQTQAPVVQASPQVTWAAPPVTAEHPAQAPATPSAAGNAANQLARLKQQLATLQNQSDNAPPARIPHALVEEHYASPPPAVDANAYSSKIIQLTDITLQEMSQSSIPTLILFYAPWCKFCMTAKPIYEEVADWVKTQNMNVMCTALNGAQYGNLVQSYGVSGYPTFVLLKNGQKKAYTGRRVSSDLHAWLKENL